jgi:signal transduction histidine kinase
MARPLAWHLGLLCAVLLLPVLVLEAVLLFRVAGAERARHEAVARDSARHIAVSIDRGLATLGAVAEVLATSDHLLADDLDAFRRRIRQLPRVSQADIVLRDADGRALLATGDAPPGMRDAAAERTALATGRAQFSGLLGPEDGRSHTFAVIVPVPAGGQDPRRVLSLRVPVAELDRLLAREGVPADMIATITDRGGTVLARTRDAERLVATRPGRGLPPDEPDGWRRGVDADGEPTVLAFARSEIAGWTAWVFMPERAFTAPLRRSLVATVVFAALFAGLAAILALSFARRITSPISALATAVARGEDAPAPTPFREVNALADAYAAARQEAGRLRAAQAQLRHVARLNEMGTLAAALAHEINQPLTAATTFSEGALRMLADPARADLAAAREAMREAADQTVLAGRIVRRLRSFLAASDGERAWTDLNELVQEAVTLALADARERGVVPRFELGPDLPCVELDRVQIEQVLVNLVRNAVEAMSDSPRRGLVIGTRQVSPDRVEVTVADTGPGVPAAVRGSLFAPFVTTKPDGMGVGLAIARDIVADHGGSLDWLPNPGGGSVFRVALPVAAATAAAPAETSHAG